MYAVYDKIIEDDKVRYKFIRETKLFGCNNGKIVELLKKQGIPQETKAYHNWRLIIQDLLSDADTTNPALIINLKPNSKSNISIYEIINVFGVSQHEWTPIMLHLHGILMDKDKNYEKINPKDFTFESGNINKDIFSFLYVNGGIKNGTINGRWTAPRSSPTNSVLLWSKTLEHFNSEANKVLQNSNTPLPA